MNTNITKNIFLKPDLLVIKVAPQKTNSLIMATNSIGFFIRSLVADEEN
jgi:hypothetical protein